MTTLQSILVKYAGKRVDTTLANQIRKEVRQNIGKGISREYYNRASKFGILKTKNLPKAIEDACNSTDSFHPAVILRGRPYSKKEED